MSRRNYIACGLNNNDNSAESLMSSLGTNYESRIAKTRDAEHQRKPEDRVKVTGE